MVRRSALESHAVGTSSDDFITPCDRRDPRPAPPPPANPAPGFALALSGGGFRATLRYSSSVSGGSVANAVLARGYPDMARAGFTGAAFDEYVLDPLVKQISGGSLKWKLLRNSWKSLGRDTRTDVLAAAFDDWWLKGMRLDELPSGVRWMSNAANMTTGVGFRFERDVLGDYVIGWLSTADQHVRLATAVAASAAVPGPFAQVHIDGPFPCANGRRVGLLDGGAYDNSGLGALDHVADACLVAVNAGGTFRVGNLGRLPIVRDLQRANAILYKQSTGLRRQAMVERFKVWEEATKAGTSPPPFGRQGVLFNLGTTLAATTEWLAAWGELP